MIIKKLHDTQNHGLVIKAWRQRWLTGNMHEGDKK